MNEKNTTALTTTTPSYIDAARTAFGAERFALLQETIGKDLTGPELALFLEVALGKKLDPFARQIYAVKRSTKKRKMVGGRWQDEWVDVMTIQTGIDGFRVIAQRTGKYAGQRGPFWCGSDGIWRDVWLHNTPPAAAKVEVHRVGFTQPLVGIALWSEYAQSKEYDGVRKPMGLWGTHPSVMIAKCAEAVALRRAFPEDLSGLYVTEEIHIEEVAQSLTDKVKELDHQLAPPVLAGELADKPEPPPEKPKAPPAEKRVSATSLMIDFKRAIDGADGANGIRAQLVELEATLARLPVGARAVAEAYARVAIDAAEALASSDEDMAKATALNDLAKQ